MNDQMPESPLTEAAQQALEAERARAASPTDEQRLRMKAAVLLRLGAAGSAGTGATAAKLAGGAKVGAREQGARRSGLGGRRSRRRDDGGAGGRRRAGECPARGGAGDLSLDARGAATGPDGPDGPDGHVRAPRRAAHVRAHAVEGTELTAAAVLCELLRQRAAVGRRVRPARSSRSGRRSSICSKVSPPARSTCSAPGPAPTTRCATSAGRRRWSRSALCPTGVPRVSVSAALSCAPCPPLRSRRASAPPARERRARRGRVTTHDAGLLGSGCAMASESSFIVVPSARSTLTATVLALPSGRVPQVCQ